MTTWRSVEPTWMTPSRTELADLHVLAYRVFSETGSAWHEAVVATASWVRGGRSGPVTFREDAPVTVALAKAELWAAAAVESMGAAPPLEAICRQLGVPYRAPQATNPAWARGVWEMLRWLTADEQERRRPPMDLRCATSTAAFRPRRSCTSWRSPRHRSTSARRSSAGS